MRRRHRETGGGEVAMMAVITKAMGAFLVLMIMLLPYYTGDTQSRQAVDDTGRRIDDAKAGLDSAVDRLKKGRLTDSEIDDILQRLQRAHDELTEAQSLIGQLRIKVDQAASQINRLEQQNATLQAEIARLRDETDALKAAVANLAAEIQRLKAFDPATLQARIRQLEKQVEETELENARLKSALAEVAPRIKALETENERLARQNLYLTEERTRLSNELAELKKAAQIDPYAYVVSECNRPDLNVSISKSDGSASDDAFDDDYVARIMPWSLPTDPRSAAPVELQGDIKRVVIWSGLLPVSKGSSTYDLFLKLNVTEQTYRSAEASGTKGPDGSIVSSDGLPGCKATLFVGWRGLVADLGTRQLGLAEPFVHIRHIEFPKDGKMMTDAKDQRPEFPRRVANAICARFGAYCMLAKRHAEWRIRGQNPWFREDSDPLARFVPPAPPKVNRLVTPSPASPK